MMTRPPDIEAQITYLPTDAGGRKTPVYSGYRPIHDFGNPEGLYGAEHEYPDVSPIPPGATARAVLWFISPDSLAKRLYEGFKFTVQDGRQVVGHGVVTKIINDRLKR